MVRRLAALALSLGLTLVGVSTASAAPPLERFIVVLQPGPGAVEEVAQQVAQQHGGAVGFVYRHALRGFSISLPAPAVEGLGHDPHVAWIEPDVQVAVTQVGSQPVPTGIDRIDADLNPPTSPLAVDIAIIDTGVYIGQTPEGQNRSHLDLNLVYVTDCTSAIFYPTFGGCDGGGNVQDENGHGTHVAGIAGALDNDIGSIGTAPGAVLWSVKALNADGSGFLGGILAAIDTVAAYADQIEVANASWGFEGQSPALDTAIANAVNQGVVFVAAAGNSAIDAATFSPANHPDVITVSALADFDGLPGGLGSSTCRPDVDDTLADFSNFGSLVEIAAPGVCIYSTYLGDGYATLSGTSMATPFVTGAVARYIAQSGFNPTNRTEVMQLRSQLVASAMPQASTCGFTGDPDSSPEPLLYLNSTLFGGNGNCGGGGPSNQPPTAAFSWNCVGLACNFVDGSTDSGGSVVSWSWNFGDGSGSTVQSPNHDYNSEGTYTVSLTVTDDVGATSSTTGSVTVTDPEPTPTMTASLSPITTSRRSASITVTVTDDGAGVAGATVFGRWTLVNRKGQTVFRDRSGVTGSNGLVTFVESLPSGGRVTSFCVTNITKSGYTSAPPYPCQTP